MFKKVLIANRGEIACRIIKTLKKMGIGSVAVYSDPDKFSLHVQKADESIRIGEAQSSKSYLNIDNIINACKSMKVDAVHPGYGFLSENVEFKKRLDKEGIKFIGPNELAIDVMGDKIRSKEVAKSCGVPTVPGNTDEIRDSNHAIEVSNEIGYPVMIKASAGGGGKGMRISYSDKETVESFERARSEALSSFGDDRIFIEKFIENPRHIEIQVLADGHGNCVYLAERECSIQRRHQKVIEECPSPFIDSSQRQLMGEKAVILAREVGYISAGTVEFIVDKDHNFYFLEMNTRLQVEHPVTEMVIGIDLVEWMVKIAYGKKLTIKQDEVAINGWAIESRIYAEDPFRGFLPSTGRITKYITPLETKNIRVDTGIYEGGEISMYYDPMIAKLCSWGKDRNEAIGFMKDALNGYIVKGLQHNMPFLSSIMQNQAFASGNLSTNFIQDEYPEGLVNYDAGALYLERMIALSTLVKELSDNRLIVNNSPNYLKKNSHFFVEYHNKTYDIRITRDSINEIVEFSKDSPNTAKVEINEKEFYISIYWDFFSPIIKVLVNKEELYLQIEKSEFGYKIHYNGFEFSPKILPFKIAHLKKYMPEKVEPDRSNFLLSPMPGLLVSFGVKEGQAVKEGESLAVVEAMKMENVLKAERDVTIKSIKRSVGSSLAVDEVIMEFE